MAISPWRIVRFTPCLVLGWGFRGRRIARRDFRFRQIQDGGSAAILENSNGDISAADRPIYFVLVLGWGLRGRRIEWRYFRFRHIQDGGTAAILENSNGDISAADRPMYFVFGSMMGFTRSTDRMALFMVSPNVRWRLGRHLRKFKWRSLRGGSPDLRRVWF